MDLLPCYLSDRDGNALYPTSPFSISYKDLSAPGSYGKQQVLLQTGEVAVFATAAVLIEGYVSISGCGAKVLRTIPFSTIRTILLSFQPNSPLRFETLGFSCSAKRIYVPDDPCSDYAEINIHIGSSVFPDSIDPNSCCGCGAEESTFDSSICFPCCLMPLHYLIYQYNALGNGSQKVFTNADELKCYGDMGILSPDSFSFCRLFVNGVLQPDTLYDLTQGRLELKTTDAPTDGAPVILLFFRLIGRRRLCVESAYYVAASDGVKTHYTNDDELPGYGYGGIPEPDEVSYWNLYVNGVLQPQAVYRIEREALDLCEAPTNGAVIILESTRILDSRCHLLNGSVSQYIAHSKGCRYFTDADAEQMYQSSGIVDPLLSSFQSVFVNGVVQPQPNYRVGNGCLAFETEYGPAPGRPVTQQAVSIFQ